MRLAAIFLVLSISSCSQPPPPEPFPISIKVESDPGRPLPGVTIARSNKPLGMTNSDGRATVKLDGAEGLVTELSVTCPEGFQTPTKPISIRLTRLAEKRIPEYAVQCPPSVRKVVVAIRAENGANLPVTYLNEPLTRTDPAGAASFALEVAPGSQFTVQILTNERKDIKPINPSKLFVVKQEDEVFLFDQKFEIERKPPPMAPKPHIPKAL